MAPVKYHAVVTALIFIAYNCVEILALYLIKYPIDIVQTMVESEPVPNPPGLWEWLHTPSGPGEALWMSLLWLGLAKIVLSFLAWAKTLSGSWQSMSMVFYMRSAVYDRLQRVGFTFHDQYSTGQLINRALNDLQNVRMFVTQGVFGGLDIVFTMIGCIWMLSQGSWIMAVAALGTLPFWFWAIRAYALRSQPIYERQMAAGDEMVRVLTENVAGVHVVRAFATEDREKEKFAARCKVLLDRLLEGVRLSATMTPLIRAVATASHIVLFSVGAILVQRGQLKLGDLVAFGAAMGLLLARVQQVNQISDAYQRAVVSSGRLFEILDNPGNTPERADAQPLHPGGGAVELSHVSFSYEPGKPVLDDISFSVPAGSKVALVGPTGSGKSSLASLLGRFYDPDIGTIKIDGDDLHDVTLASVRESVGYVFQENYLFSDTIARNIAYSDIEAPRSKIEEAARIARASEFIERLPNRYDTVIGEYGASLSGGQKQRLAIARAILHNPRILVFDDALSAVDPETEAQIRGELERLVKGRTLFMIASRISTARHADIIFVIENGKLTQRGTHKELMQQPGYYQAVASSQFASVDGDAGTKASHMDRVVRATQRRSGRLDLE